MKKLVYVLSVMTMVGMSQFTLADSSKGGLDIAPVNNQLYNDECGSCHFAFQPGFLPERSWRKLMSGLNDHFGENAELNDADRQALTDYLVAHAAENDSHRRASKFLKSIRSGDTPLRISEVPYFTKEHREIPRGVIGNKVKSIANCDACHQGAAKGSYAEREINIPGYGRWDD